MELILIATFFIFLKKQLPLTFQSKFENLLLKQILSNLFYKKIFNT